MPALRPSNPRRTILVALVAGILLALLAAPVGIADTFTPESGGSPNADQIDSLYKIILYVAIVIFLIVEGTLLWALIKYRARRDGPEAAQIHGNTPLELGWTVGAAVILVVLSVVTFLYLGDIRNPPASGPEGLASGLQVASIDQPDPPKGESKPLEIKVNGQQFVWRYEYPNGAFNYYELVAPVDTTVVMKVTASDVIHSWWIPKMFGKVDAVPGYTNETWFKAPRTGTYIGQCAELCGSGHADMRARVRVVEPEQYTAFIERQKRDIEAAGEALAEQRAQREQIEQSDTGVIRAKRS
ncbi:MAG TPA: cytochrome c oxidase subunit II [Thermoleophilaceae bacterium]|nr:cytochrome c oxidase subunit II [Thermoleophilaceae bacterium]